MSVYGDVSSLLIHNFPSTSSLYCCHRCECFWADEKTCFLCFQEGELLAVPREGSGLKYVNKPNMSLTPFHIIVSDKLLHVLKDMFILSNQHANRILA